MEQERKGELYETGKEYGSVKERVGDKRRSM